MNEGYKAYTIRMDHTGGLYVSRGIKTSWNKELNSRVVALGGGKGVQILVTGSKPGQGLKNQVLRTVSLVKLTLKGRSQVSEIGLVDHAGNAQTELGSSIVVHVDLRRPTGVPSVGASGFHVGTKLPDGSDLPIVIGCTMIRRNMKTDKHMSTNALFVIPSNGLIVLHPNGWSGRLYELGTIGTAADLKLVRDVQNEDKRLTTAELKQARRAERRARHCLRLLEGELCREDLSKDARAESIRESRSLAREISTLDRVFLKHKKAQQVQIDHARKVADRGLRRGRKG